MTDRLR
jgi:hypothetical protein